MMAFCFFLVIVAAIPFYSWRSSQRFTLTFAQQTLFRIGDSFGNVYVKEGSGDIVSYMIGSAIIPTVMRNVSFSFEENLGSEEYSLFNVSFSSDSCAFHYDVKSTNPVNIYLFNETQLSSFTKDHSYSDGYIAEKDKTHSVNTHVDEDPSGLRTLAVYNANSEKSKITMSGWIFSKAYDISATRGTKNCSGSCMIQSSDYYAVVVECRSRSCEDFIIYEDYTAEEGMITFSIVMPIILLIIIVVEIIMLVKRRSAPEVYGATTTQEDTPSQTTEGDVPDGSGLMLQDIEPPEYTYVESINDDDDAPISTTVTFSEDVNNTV